MLRTIGYAFSVLLCSVAAAPAQNNSLPSSDWSNSWGFSSGDRQFRLLQSDLIKKGEEGFYESLGRQSFSVNNSVTYDYSQGRMEVQVSDGAQVDVSNRTGSDIGQNTNVVGAINQSETIIDISGDGNSVSAQNGATATGCQNGGISIDSPNTSGSPTTCN